jgi:hypothetical protein
MLRLLFSGSLSNKEGEMDQTSPPQVSSKHSIVLCSWSHLKIENRDLLGWTKMILLGPNEEASALSQSVIGNCELSTEAAA